MERKDVSGQLPMHRQPIVFESTFYGKYRVLAVFLIASALLIAAFAISAVWLQKDGDDWRDSWGGLFEDSESNTESDPSPTDSEEESTKEDAVPLIPEGATPIVERDLSAPSLGASYIHNETPYAPEVETLLGREVSVPSPDGAPLVLILHTHTGEAYLPQGSRYVEGTLGDATYSRDTEKNVLSVGRVLCDTLNKKGITAIHCTVMHDDPTLSGSYLRSAETVTRYLKQYPSIAYVIDLHRDAVTTSEGELVRAVAEYNGKPIAQVLSVIGTDCNGTSHENWSDNLALALQLREALNQKGTSICRPVSLRNSSYNQELARYALLLEIGTAANSAEEANRAATLVGETLAELLQAR